MSLEKRSTHVRLPPDLDHKLAVIAMLAEKDKAEIASMLLSKAIAGEWWQAQSAIERARALGIVRD